MPNKLTDVTDNKVGKMTDAEVKKALEHCADVNSICETCVLFIPKDDDCKCSRVLKRNALDLINRQEQENESLKAEVERLKQIVGFTPARGSGKSPFLNMVLDNVRAEAYKECIEKVKEHSNKMELVCSGALVKTDYTITDEDLDNLLNELVGDEDRL